MRWIRDEAFIRGSLPMTKFDVRVLTMAFLEIEKGDVLLDIGAGTGSISVEAALHGALVYAIEKEKEGVRLIQENGRRFGVEIHVINETAPKGIDKLSSFNKCFIGGSGGNLKEIFYMVDQTIIKGGILAGNFVRLENVCQFKSLLVAFGYENIEIRHVQSSILDSRIGMLRAQNPVFLVKGQKN